MPSVLLAVTNHLLQTVAAIPFLWALPLTLDLLSFIVYFEPSQWAWQPACLPLPALAIGAMSDAYAQQFDTGTTSIQVIITVFALGLFACCILCHGEMARLKPPPQFLMSFYLMMSDGGALGGVFVLYRELSRGWWHDWHWLTAEALTAGLIYFLANDVRDSLHSFTLTNQEGEHGGSPLRGGRLV